MSEYHQFNQTYRHRSSAENKNQSMENRLAEAEKKLDVIYDWIQRKFGDVLVQNHPNPIIIDIHQPWVKLVKLPEKDTAKKERAIKRGRPRIRVSQQLPTKTARRRPTEQQVNIPQQFYQDPEPRGSSDSDAELLNMDDFKDEPLSEPESELPILCKSDLGIEEYESGLVDVDPLSFPSTSTNDSPQDTQNINAKLKRQSKHIHKRTYSCPAPNCIEEFETKESLRIHKVFYSHSQPASKSLCSICGKQVSTDGLANHLRIHSSKCEYKCDTCGKEFKQVQGLKVHVACHSGLKQQCNICGITVSYQKLGRHIKNVHEKIRPFECPKCKLKFKYGYHLKSHLRTHENPNSKKRGLNKDRDNFVTKVPRKSSLHNNGSASATENLLFLKPDLDHQAPVYESNTESEQTQNNSIIHMPMELSESDLV